MTADEWEQIKSIFDAALLLPPGERAQWLDSACAGRPDVRTTVENLLRNFDDAGSFLEAVTSPLDREPSFTVMQLVADRFRVLRLIAAGGMGEVYEVYDERLRVRVALKTIRADLAANKSVYERFKREVWVTRDVIHHGICRVFELIEHRDPANPDAPVVPCLTMKLLDGHDLQTELKNRGALPLREVLALTRQICEALHALHQSDIIHRDLKPSNIMLVPDDDLGTRVVLTDFGLARPLNQTTLHITHAGTDQPGAPYFQAPEVLKGEKDSVASDIYALGLVIDEMLTTSRAFTAESVYSLYWQKVFDQPIPPSKRALHLPAPWERVILKCLSSAPGSRYSCPLEVLRDLSKVSAADLARIETLSSPESRSWSDAFVRRVPSAPVVRRAALVCSALVPLVVGFAMAPGLTRNTPPAGIAVLPIVDETHDLRYAYVSKAIQSELMRRLRGVPQVSVYEVPEKKLKLPVPEPEHIQYSLKMSLQTKSDRVRLALQLSDNGPGHEVVWSDELQTATSDLLSLEGRAATQLVGRVQELTGPKIAGIRLAEYRHNPLINWALHNLRNAGAFDLPAAATPSATAYEYYVRGRSLLDQRTAAAALKATQYFEDATLADPGFALAWAGLSDAQHILMEFDSADREDSFLRARSAAERAVFLGPNLPETHVTLGAAMQLAWDWERSRQSYETAIQLDPRFARGQRWYAGLLMQTGNVEQSLSRARLSLSLDPWDFAGHSAYGLYLFQAARPQEAVDHLERSLAQKDLIGMHTNLGLIYAWLSGTSTGSARATYLEKALHHANILREQEIREAVPSAATSQAKWADVVSALAYAYAQQPDMARPALDRLEHERLTGRRSSVSISMVYAALGNAERSLDLLEMAAAYHERELTSLKINPFFATLREQPRYQQLLKRMGLVS